MALKRYVFIDNILYPHEIFCDFKKDGKQIASSQLTACIGTKRDGSKVVAVNSNDPELGLLLYVEKMNDGSYNPWYNYISDERACLYKEFCDGYYVKTICNVMPSELLTLKSAASRRPTNTGSSDPDLVYEGVRTAVELAYKRDPHLREAHGRYIITKNKGMNPFILKSDDSMPGQHTVVPMRISSVILEKDDPNYEECSGLIPEYRQSKMDIEQSLLSRYPEVKTILDAFTDGSKSIEDIFASLGGSSAGSYTLDDFTVDPGMLMPVMEMGLDYQTWFTLNFPNGANSKEDVMNRIQQDKAAYMANPSDFGANYAANLHKHQTHQNAEPSSPPIADVIKDTKPITRPSDYTITEREYDKVMSELIHDRYPSLSIKEVEAVREFLWDDSPKNSDGAVIGVMSDIELAVKLFTGMVVSILPGAATAKLFSHSIYAETQITDIAKRILDVMDSSLTITEKLSEKNFMEALNKFLIDHS